MRRGEIRWGSPAMPGGSRKRRPFVVVSDDLFNRNDRYPKVLVVHLTSVRHLGGPYPWEVDLPRGCGGLPAPSTVKCGEIYTLFKADLGEPSGTLPKDQLRRIDRALAVALGLPADEQP